MQETPDRTVPSHLKTPLPGNTTTAGPALKHSLKHNAVHVTKSVKISPRGGLVASHVPGSGSSPAVASSSATALRASFINSFLSDVSAQVSNLDAWTVSRYNKFSANRYSKIFGLALLGLFILLFFGRFYTHHQ